MSDYSNRSVSEFNKLMDVLSDAENGVCRSNTDQHGVKSMDNILRNFNNAVNEVSNLSTKPDKEMSQIKDTQMVSENTLRIGDYQIEKDDGTYTLLDENGIVLVDNVLLYETVYAIATHLYQGKTFSSSKIVSLLYNNSRYEKHLHEARFNKTNYNKYKTDSEFDMMDIETTKFEENKHRAKLFKRNILNEYNNLGK
jgi:hypothetical protein